MFGRSRIAFLALLSLCVPMSGVPVENLSTGEPFDVVVYGGTAGGAVASIAAAEEGLRVALLEPRRHIGGMVSGGLGRTDFGNQSVIGGMSRKFFERVGERYGEAVSWYFEPHVAEAVFLDWLEEAGVAVFFDHRVDSVRKEGNRIQTIRMENGAVFSASVFMDASYEGDLLPRAGTTYTWGREGRDVYGESLAGRITYSPKHQFPFPVSPYDSDGNLLPLIYTCDPGKQGEGDKKVQAYNFRLCLTDRRDNQVPFPKPEGYDPARYEILKRYLALAPDLEMKDLLLVAKMPNQKTDMNNKGPISTDFIGGSWEYPEADYKRREEIWEEHKRYVQGFLYFLANDPSVPQTLQEESNRWGLAKDEFVDTDHWPHQLYIREARRTIGEYVMQQKDLQTERTKPDSIGMGSYNSDSHHVQRIPATTCEDWEVPGPGLLNEGDMQVPVEPYEMSYRAFLPKRNECDNLLVISCFSASHVAYSSMRMEPQYMIIGQAAGVAAAQAIREKVPVQDINTTVLQQRLREQKQILSLSDVLGLFEELRGIIVDNSQAQTEGPWRHSASVPPFYGYDYLHDDGEGNESGRARFIPDVPKAGNYEIRLAYTANPNRADRVTVRIHTEEGPVTRIVDEKQHPGPHAPFLSLGKFSLPAGQGGFVEVLTEGANGYVVADAVQWIWVE